MYSESKCLSDIIFIHYLKSRNQTMTCSVYLRVLGIFLNFLLTSYNSRAVTIELTLPMTLP